jgi:hypothetical protein
MIPYRIYYQIEANLSIILLKCLLYKDIHIVYEWGRIYSVIIIKLALIIFNKYREK